MENRSVLFGFFEDCWKNGTVLTVEMKRLLRKAASHKRNMMKLQQKSAVMRIRIKNREGNEMQEMTKEQLQEQLQIEIYKSISLQEELDQKNKERAEYKALYTFAQKKREELQEQLSAALSAKENNSEPAPVTE